MFQTWCPRGNGIWGGSFQGLWEDTRARESVGTAGTQRACAGPCPVWIREDLLQWEVFRRRCAWKRPTEEKQAQKSKDKSRAEPQCPVICLHSPRVTGNFCRCRFHLSGWSCRSLSRFLLSPHSGALLGLLEVLCMCSRQGQWIYCGLYRSFLSTPALSAGQPWDLQVLLCLLASLPLWWLPVYQPGLMCPPNTPSPINVVLHRNLCLLLPLSCFQTEAKRMSGLITVPVLRTKNGIKTSSGGLSIFTHSLLSAKAPT